MVLAAAATTTTTVTCADGFQNSKSHLAVSEVESLGCRRSCRILDSLKARRQRGVRTPQLSPCCVKEMPCSRWLMSIKYASCWKPVSAGWKGVPVEGSREWGSQPVEVGRRKDLCWQCPCAELSILEGHFVLTFSTLISPSQAGILNERSLSMPMASLTYSKGRFVSTSWEICKLTMASSQTITSSVRKSRERECSVKSRLQSSSCELVGHSQVIPVDHVRGGIPAALRVLSVNRDIVFVQAG